MSTHLVPHQSAALGPASCLSRLAPPLHDMSVNGDRILYYIKVGAAKGAVSLRNLPPEVARAVAMLTLKSNRTFNIHWYPHDGPAQVLMGLPFSQLPQMVSDLCGAGFGAPVHSQPIASKSLRVS